jgi:hypothetical protein
MDYDDDNYNYQMHRLYHQQRVMIHLQQDSSERFQPQRPSPSLRYHPHHYHHRYNTTTTSSMATEHYEAMVHPSLLIHPNPYRVIIIYDDESGQLLQNVLLHTFVQEVIYILPVTTSTSPSSIIHPDDGRITLIFSNDPVSSMQQLSLNMTTPTSQTTVDVVFVDYMT